MPLDFPPSPTNGQVYDQWQWDGSKWVAIVGTLPAGPAGPTGATGPQGDPGISAGRIFYYDATDASDIAGYAKLLASPSANPEKTLAVACTGVGVDFAVEEFITDPGVPGAVDYPAGTAYRRIYAHVNSGTARLHLRIYVRTAAGVETLVRDEVSPDFSDQVVTLQEWVASAPAGGAMGATDRIVNKISAQRVTGGGGTVTVTCHFEGTTTGSHIQTTISTGAVGPTGPTGPAGPQGATGPQGPQGIPGAGSVSGMTAGQIPIAASATAISSSANLSGDVTSNATLVTTLATVNANVGTFAVSTVNAKGLVTAAASMTGDITTAAGVSTLATVNANVGTFQGLTVNGKGLVTAAANQSYAPLASPTFTGTPTLPTGTVATTQTAGNSTTAVATTAFVATSFAPLASPTFTGTPTLPTGTVGVTQAAATNNTTLATTAYVKSQAYLPLSGSAPMTGTLTVNVNTTILPAGPGGMSMPLHLGSVDGSAGAAVFDAFGSTLYLDLRRANGTAAAPTAVTTGDSLGGLLFQSHFGGGVNNYNTAAYIYAVAREPWTTTARGSYLAFETNLVGTTTAGARVVVGDGVMVGLPIANDPGAGNLAVATGVTIGPANGGSLKFGGTGNANATIAYDGNTYVYIMAPGAGVASAGINIGNVGTGSVTLHRNAAHTMQSINGGATFANFNSTGTFNVSGAWGTLSSADIKENIKPYTRGLDAILQLEPVEYTYKPGTPFAVEEGETEPTRFGLIAQQVEPHVPEIVGEVTVRVREEDQVFTTLQPTLLIYALIGSIKELNAKIAALEAAGKA